MCPLRLWIVFQRDESCLQMAITIAQLLQSNKDYSGNEMKWRLLLVFCKEGAECKMHSAVLGPNRVRHRNKCH